MEFCYPFKYRDGTNFISKKGTWDKLNFIFDRKVWDKKKLIYVYVISLSSLLERQFYYIHFFKNISNLLSFTNRRIQSFVYYAWYTFLECMELFSCKNDGDGKLFMVFFLSRSKMPPSYLRNESDRPKFLTERKGRKS